MPESSRPRRSSDPSGRPSRGRAGGSSAGGRSTGGSGGRPTAGSGGRGASGSRGQSSDGGGRRGGQGSGSSGDRRSSSYQGGSGRGSSKGGPGDRRGARPDRRTDSRGERGSQPRTEDQARYDGPDIPEEITGKELDRSVNAQLKGLPEKLALRVARHLAAAGMLIDSDPEVAYQHTLAARARAARLAVVREACGEAAYAAGHYAEALSELRAAKRMNGATDYLPIMADCERALGRPERALALAKNPSVAKFAPEAKAEMTIVEAGARRDMGEFDAALRTLEHAPLQTQARAPWVTRLRYAYADTLVAAGRLQDALEWFHRTEAIDGDELTDAGERAAEIERERG